MEHFFAYFNFCVGVHIFGHVLLANKYILLIHGGINDGDNTRFDKYFNAI